MSAAHTPRHAQPTRIPLASQVIGLIEMDAPIHGESGWENLSVGEDLAFSRQSRGGGLSRISAIERGATSMIEADHEQLLLDLQAELNLVLRRIRAK